MLGTPDSVATDLAQRMRDINAAPSKTPDELPEYSCGLFAGGTRGAPDTGECWWPGYVRQPLADTVSWTLPANPGALAGPVCGRPDAPHYHPSRVVVFDSAGHERCSAPVRHVGSPKATGFGGIFIALLSVGMAMPGDTVTCHPPKP